MAHVCSHRAVTAAAAAAAIAVLLPLGGTLPAAAADARCTPATTLTASADVGADELQARLDLDAPVICLSGEFSVTAPLTADHSFALIGATDGALTGAGAAILVHSGASQSIELTDLTISDGASVTGAAIDAVLSSVTVVRSVFRDNSGTSGGALRSATATIEASLFSGNTGLLGGAVVVTEAIRVTDSTFVGNTAGEDGGALRTAGTVDVTNSTFVGNTAGQFGGAIAAFGGRSAFSTYLDNAAGAPGRAGESIFLRASTEPYLELRATIFAGSSSEAHFAIGGGDFAGEYLDFGGNVFSSSRALESDLLLPDETTLFDQSVASIFGASPALVDGPGVAPSLSLPAGSVAIGRVPIANRTATPDPALDQRGVARTPLLDAGSVEGPAPAVTPGPSSPLPPPAGPTLAESGGAVDGAALALGALGLVVLGALALGRRPRART